MKPVYDFAHTKEELLERAGGKLPEGTMVVPGRKEEAGFYLVPAFAKLTGKQLKDSHYQMKTEDFLSKGTPHGVQIEFKSDGAKKFYELNQRECRQEVAIILDNVVVSAPSVNEPIEGGVAYISGNFSQETADELVALLKSGAFTAPVEVIEERHIGPSLGAESIHKGLLSCGIALGLLFFLVFLCIK